MVDRRRHQRQPVKLAGRYMLPGGAEYRCETVDVFEQLARRLCQAAHVDPDSMVEPAFAGAGYSSVNPASGLVPAWHRFRSAAENVYGMRSELMRKPKPRR